MGCPAKIVYFDHAARAEGAGPVPGDPAQGPFAWGEAGMVWVEPDGAIDTDTQGRIPPNARCALHGLGVVEALEALGPVVGPIAPGRDAVLGPAQVEPALRILYEADRRTYGARHDLRVHVTPPPDATEYRIVIDNRGYQRTLSQLQFMTSTAARLGRGVRLRV